MGPLTRFAHGGRCRVAAEVREVPPASSWVGERPRAAAGGVSRPERMALPAVEQAIREAGFEPSLRTAAGVFVGATVGGMGESEEAYRRRRCGEDRRWRLSRLLGMPLSTSAG